LDLSRKRAGHSFTAVAEEATAFAPPAAADGGADITAQLERHRQAAVEAWSLDNELVLIGAGEKIPIPGRADRTYPFRAHSEYLYLSDRERPSGVLAFDPKEGWVDFVKPVTRDERLWEGASTGDEAGVPLSELTSWLEQRKDRPIASLGAAVPDVRSADELGADLRYALNAIRRRKNEAELARMRAAERATSAGFAAIVPLIEPGRTERELQIELEAAFFRNGGDFLAFDTIVGGGRTRPCSTSRRRRAHSPTATWS
jgi:Xaa-Pro aminopeptidase